MACKSRRNATASDTKLSDTIVAFLNAQNQDLCAKSIVQTSLLVMLPKLAQIQIHCKLDAIGFAYEAPTLLLPPTKSANEAEDNSDDEMDIHLFNNALTHLLKWVGEDGFNQAFLTSYHHLPFWDLGPVPSSPPPNVVQSSAQLNIQLSAPTWCFLAAMDQNRQVASKFTKEELKELSPHLTFGCKSQLS
ncbi:hypothetical protein P691DRAFT_768923 [Macrolepiota fuliginosa MF-IS2]|uniref:Uncharacterized protein n=1 Tax=Macrolepiota fuliginosa MF-IS2 TaxID=1400762 RepID=A0A9P5WXN9_9AGAR|nr:hypothetical protein P691DRAFT_768923 [Macrolepiota fuliginosa MF-IS2]